MPAHFCKRSYLSVTGFILAAFLGFHLALNLLALWPAQFQAAINALHRLSWRLVVLEISVVFLPLAIHLGFGLQVLWQDKLKYNPDKLRGSALGQCLQQASALILLVFLAVHLLTLHRWFGGAFDPGHAGRSVTKALWQPYGTGAAAARANSLVAAFYPVGLLAALFHTANGIYTGADILGLTPTPLQQLRLWRISLGAMACFLLAALAAWYAAAL